jgi:hypothetical protein
MNDMVWTLHDSAGALLRATQTFSSQEEAEAWMGSNWSSLLDEGAESVCLVQGEETLYEMGLREE